MPKTSAYGSESRVVPEKEILFSFARSGGPGGQGVNTAESKAILRWHVGGSSAFSEEEKDRIRKNAPNLTDKDEIVIHCSESRAQLANRIACADRLHQIVGKALVIQKKRKPTRKSLGRKNRDLDAKSVASRKKQGRRRVDFDGRIG